MTTPAGQTTAPKVEIKGFAADQVPPPQLASMFQFSRFGGDVSLVIGYINIHGLATQAVANPGVGFQTTATPTHHFQMSLGALVLMRQRMDELIKGMAAQGIHLPNATPDKGTA
jgi:hypothetical protein